MDRPWRELIEPETVEVLAPGGALRSRVEAWFSGEQLIIEDMNVDVMPGDEVRRRLPNGRDDAYRVTNPTCYRGGPFGPHYQVEVSRGGSGDPRPSGHHAISVSGPNARVNIHSTDRSTNINNSGSVFGDLRAALQAGVSDEDRRAALLAEVDRMEVDQSDPRRFAQAFQGFMALAADAMSIVTPFLPQLTALLAS